MPAGRFGKKDFIKFYKQLYPNSTNYETSKLCQIAFKAFDLNRDGYIDFSEFINAVLIASSDSLAEKLKIIFQVYDENNDGMIRIKEARKILKVQNFYDID